MYLLLQNTALANRHVRTFTAGSATEGVVMLWKPLMRIFELNIYLLTLLYLYIYYETQFKTIFAISYKKKIDQNLWSLYCSV